MSELDDLLAACVANPDDDAPRLVWADAIGGERGEFVVLQCRLRDDTLGVAERGALIARHDELLRAHGRAWSAFADRAVAQCRFRRGFVEAIEAAIGVMTLAQMFDAAPLLASLHACGISRMFDYREGAEPVGRDAIAELTRLFVDPLLKRLRGIEIDDAVIHEITGDSEWDHDVTSLADQVLELVARSGALGGMRALGIRDTFTPRGMHELLSSNALADLESLAFEFGEADRSQVQQLFAAMPMLRVLHANSALQLNLIADLIPTTVVELRASVNERDDLAALATSPVAASLERLQITGGNLHELPSYFAAFPRLRSLDICYAGHGALVAGREARRRQASTNLVTSALPNLRELHVHHEAANDEVLAVAEAFGTQLECLDVLGHKDLTCVDELRTKIAGHVRAGPFEVDHPLLAVGVDTREPWLRYGTCNLV